MPNHKRPAGQTEAEYARGAWDWAQEPLQEGGYGTQVSLDPTAQPGVWRVCVRLLQVVDGRPAAVWVQVKGTWPNSQHSDFWAYVMRLQFELQEAAVRDATWLMRDV